MTWPMRGASCALYLSLFLPSAGAGAATIAYYQFEGGADLQSVATPVADETGSNPLTVEDGSTAVYRSAVPAPVVPQTGAPNLASIDFSSTSAAALHSTQDSFALFPGNHWTIEAYVNLTELGSFQIFVGKDGIGSGFADLYLQRNGRNGAFSILFRGSD